MENATKALMIAAGVLIGILIMTLGVTLYTLLGEYVSDAQTRIENADLVKFNEQFLKYANKEDQDGNGTLTIRDVISARNAALEANLEYEEYAILYNQESTLPQATENKYYVDVYFKNGKQKEQNILREDMTKLLETYIELNNIKCEVTISSKTGRVYKVIFSYEG